MTSVIAFAVYAVVISRHLIADEIKQQVKASAYRSGKHTCITQSEENEHIERPRCFKHLAISELAQLDTHQAQKRCETWMPTCQPCCQSQHIKKALVLIQEHPNHTHKSYSTAPSYN